MMSASEKVL